MISEAMCRFSQCLPILSGVLPDHPHWPFDTGVTDGLIASNPCTLPRAMKTRVSVSRCLKRDGTATEEELQDACDSTFRDQFHPVLTLLVDKGFLVAGSGEGVTRYRMKEGFNR